jgi:ABC-type Na+ transport system ATPase subunit NatA
MYTIKDQNGLYVDERAIGIMPDETEKEEWTYHGYTNIFNGTYIYPTKQKAEKVMEYLNKLNEMAGFDLQLHIEALKKDYTIPSKIQLTTKPIARGTKTKVTRMIKQLKKELTS